MREGEERRVRERGRVTKSGCKTVWSYLANT